MLAAWLALLLGAGCRDRDGAPLPAETDEPLFVQGMQLKKLDRHAEALNAFLKVIEKRGERAAPESHLEAGLIYLNHSKEPIEASHHLRKYLQLQPNSKRAVFVMGMVDKARLEFARSLPGRPLEDQSAQLTANEEVARLRRENEELRAENAALRSGGAVAASRASRMIVFSPEPAPGAVAVAPPVAQIADTAVVPAPRPSAPQPVAAAAPTQRAGLGVQPAPRATTPTAGAPATRNGGQAGGAGTRSAPTPPTTTARPAGGKAHTVAAKDTLYSIARRHGVRVEDIVAANRATVPSVNTPLKVGTVLKIP